MLFSSPRPGGAAQPALNQLRAVPPVPPCMRRSAYEARGYTGAVRSTGKLGLGALIVGAAAALSAGAAFGHKAIRDCGGAQLAGQFRVVTGSGAAGSISYRLTLRNTSATRCTVTGLPLGQLLGRRKTNLPTHVRAAHPGALTA